jgi:hypothetical protein
MFRKKPIVIEAHEWDGSSVTEIFMREMWGPTHISGREDNDELVIRTLEGEMRASRGDWIIKGVKGEFYPCKPDIFEATYERVE